MKLAANKHARASRLSRVRPLVWWLALLIVCNLVGGFQRLAARNAGERDFASHRLASRPGANETVKAEILRMQQERGISLASLGFGLQIVLFDKRTLFQIPVSRRLGVVRGTISLDGTEIIVSHFDINVSDSLKLLRTDGSEVRDLPFARTGEAASHVDSLCWSHDKSKLAMTVYRGSPEVKLEILDIGSGIYQAIAPSVKKLTSQCWSSDDKSIVYEAGDGVRIREVGNDNAVMPLAPGAKNPTWSPDGNWIAFQQGDIFYEIRPDGRDKKKLLSRKEIYTPLWWSPDSRFVAYVASERFAIDDFYQLRVRRLVDESEYRVAEGQISGNYQWLVSPQLVRQAGSQTKPH